MDVVYEHSHLGREMTPGRIDGANRRFFAPVAGEDRRQTPFTDVLPNQKGSEVNQAAQTMLRRLWKLDLSDGKPVALPVSARSIHKFEEWVDLKKRAAEADEDGVWGQWLGKQGGVALRLALVLELLWWAADAPAADTAGPTKISAAALTAAMKFIDTYAAPMAALTLVNAARPVEDQNATRLLRMLVNKGDDQFNARLVGRGSHGPAGRLSQPSDMAAACEVLVAAKLIRHVGERADGKAGRRPSIYEVNPLLLKPRQDVKRRGAR